MSLVRTLHAVSMMSVIAAMALGCTPARRGGSESDAGSTGDSSVTNDSGIIIVIPDSGVNQGGNDASSGGQCVGTTQMLPALPSADLPRCAAATLTAIAACTTSACVQNALAADTTPASTDGINCGSCVAYEQLTCLQSNGCLTQVSDYGCCAQTICNGNQSCEQSTCGSRSNDLSTCAQAHGAACSFGSAAVASCFGS